MDIRKLITTLSEKHYLKGAPEAYVDGFIRAANAVYPTAKLKRILQEKFSIPNDRQFKLDHFLQSAAELSVQDHLKRHGSVGNFEIDWKVRAPKNVEAYYKIGRTHVSLEVKCPEERKLSADSLVLKTAGRVPDHLGTFRKLKTAIERPGSENHLELAQNTDHKMKEALLSANGKFPEESGVNHLNVLFIACGDVGSIQGWCHCLYGGEGLFTRESFFSPETYRLVDIVLLSNLKYLHCEARDYNDWTMDRAFLLPCINPRGRRSLVHDSIQAGLCPFKHHLERFTQFKEILGPNEDPEIVNQVKVIHYIAKGMEKAEQKHYFPVLPGQSDPRKKR